MLQTGKHAAEGDELVLECFEKTKLDASVETAYVFGTPREARTISQKTTVGTSLTPNNQSSSGWML